MASTQWSHQHPISSRVIARSLLACTAVVLVPLTGSGVAAADTHTGYVLTVTCGSTTTTVVSPTSPAAASQDVSSTQTIIFAGGAFFAPDHFPTGKVVYCDLFNETTGKFYADLPFLIKGSP